MAHFAQLDENNIVTQVIVVANAAIDNLPYPDSEPVGVAFCQEIFGADTVWKQTSYNGNFRYFFAGRGFTYDPVRDAFISPSPFPSWILDQQTLKWEPPVPPPNDGKPYTWDEATLSWVEIPPPPPEVLNLVRA